MPLRDFGHGKSSSSLRFQTRSFLRGVINDANLRKDLRKELEKKVAELNLTCSLEELLTQIKFEELPYEIKASLLSSGKINLRKLVEVYELRRISEGD